MARAPGPATLETVMRCPPFAALDLYWIPLGAGGHSVRLNGKVYETLDAARRHRSRCDLYHTALVVELDGDRYTIELAPSPDGRGSSRGVVATGPVGTRRAGRWRLFRYEVRRWHGGSIPDLDEAVGGPLRLSRDPEAARRLLDLVPAVPTPTWGRDELHVGEGWNSNSVIAWLIASAGLPATSSRRHTGALRDGTRVSRWHGATPALRVFTEGGSARIARGWGGGAGWRRSFPQAGSASTSITRSKEES